MASVSVVIVAQGAKPDQLVAAFGSLPESDCELIVVGDPFAAPELAAWKDQAKVVTAGETPAGQRNAAVNAATGDLVVVVNGHESLAPEALTRHAEALAADPNAVASYGRTAVHEEGHDVRLRPEKGRGGHVVSRLVKQKHLVASQACLVWRRGTLSEAPFRAESTTPAALRLGLALDLAAKGEFVFVGEQVAERISEPLDLVALEELVKVFLGILYSPDSLDDKLEQRARFRLARHLVAMGKQYYRAEDYRLAGKFFDEALKAAPSYFKGRRYQFLNFVKNTISRG
ncbi:glycosyltransferase [Planctomycetota bacterium]|nr:glycosyltransferase [Planctomycetota bacterium]